jgi:hypothetical protein
MIARAGDNAVAGADIVVRATDNDGTLTFQEQRKVPSNPKTRRSLMLAPSGIVSRLRSTASVPPRIKRQIPSVTRRMAFG